jgi:hypothetical protein
MRTQVLGSNLASPITIKGMLRRIAQPHFLAIIRLDKIMAAASSTGHSGEKSQHSERVAAIAHASEIGVATTSLSEWLVGESSIQP